PGPTPVIRKRSSWSPVPSRSFLHWSGPQLSFPAGDIWSVVIVYKVRFQNRIPLRSWAATEEATSPNAIEASNTPRILASRNVCIGCIAVIEEDLTRAADARYSAPYRNSWRRRVRSAQSPSSRRGPPIEIGAIKRDAGERRAAQGGAAQRGIGEIRILERCEFEVDARQIRIAQDCPLEIAGF